MHHFLSILLLVWPSLTSLEADFSQTKTSSMFVTPQQAQGHLSFRSPSYLSWAYTSPEKQVWTLDDNKGSGSPLARQLMQLILQTITGSYLQPNADFDVSLSDSTANLTPKKRDLKRLFSSITIYFDSASQIAKQVLIIEPNGDQTDIRFSHTSYQYSAHATR